MNKKLVGAALVGLFSAAVASQAMAAYGSAEVKLKCYGISEAGKNDCASADGAHSCAGQSTVNKGKSEWKYVDTKEVCEKDGGSVTAPEAAQ